MDRLLDDFVDRLPFRKESGEQIWNPEIDVRETDNEIIVEAEVPGMDQKDVNVTIKDNVLTLKGEKKREQEEKEANYYRVERTYGSFMRTMMLPSRVSADKATAKYKNGVLRITVPKIEEVKPKEIAIEVK